MNESHELMLVVQVFVINEDFTVELNLN